MQMCKVVDLKPGMMIRFQYGMEDNIVEVEVTGISKTGNELVSISFLINSRIDTINVSEDSEFEVIEKAKNINELEILVNETPALIEHNFTEVKASLSAMMEAYEGLTYTEDTVTVARNDVSTLRKIRKVIDDKRKEVKKAHMIPYEEFEAKAKELCEIIDNAIIPINKQIDEYSELKKKEKKAKILEYFNSQIGELDLITFEDVFNEKWVSNMSTTMKSIKAELDEYITTVKQDVDTIKSFGSEVEEKALSTYKGTKRLADAINIINDYEKQKTAILAREEAKRKAEEERKRQEEIRRKQEEDRKAREAEERRIREEERKKQAEIERIRAEERAKIQKELAEKQVKEREEREDKERIERERAATLAKEQAVKEPEPLPFETDDTLPFVTVPDKPQEQTIETLPFDTQEQVQEVVPAQQEKIVVATFTLNTTVSNVKMIEDFLLSNDISFIKKEV